MKPTRTILFRVIQALENNQNRFSEAFKVAARKAWNIKTKDRTASSPNGAKKETK